MLKGIGIVVVVWSAQLCKGYGAYKVALIVFSDHTWTEHNRIEDNGTAHVQIISTYTHGNAEKVPVDFRKKGVNTIVRMNLY